MTEALNSNLDRTARFGRSGASANEARDIRLLVGPYRAGKTLQLIDELIDFCRQQPLMKALVVVPSQRYRTLFEARLMERLKQSGVTTGISGLQIVPFYKACEIVLRKFGVPFLLVPEQVRVAVIARVVSTLLKEGKIQTLAPIIDFSGTRAALLELIDELQRAAVLPGHVIAKLEETAQSDSRYIELARIYEKYCDELDALGYLDERGIAFAARTLLTQERKGLRFGFVAADGFDRFNLLQLHVLEGLSRHATNTRVCFDYVNPEHDSDNEYLWKSASFSELKTIFHHAAEHVAPVSDVSAAKDVRMIQVLDRFFEATEVARMIKRRIVEGGKPSQVLVVARSITPYSAPIRAAFEDAGINYFLDEAVPLDSLPIVQFLMRLFELSTIHDFKRAELIACLRSPNFRLASVCETERDLHRISSLSLEDNVVESRHQWLEMVRIRAEKFSPSLPQALTNFLADLAPPHSGSLREYVIWCEDLVDRYLQIISDAGDDPFERWEEHRALFELRRCFGSLIHEENICGATSCSADYFLGRLRKLVERGNFRRQPRTEEYVTVCGADLAPNRTFEEVFILGLVEGEFPKKPHQSGFLSSDEIGRWLSFGIDLSNPRFHAQFEPALFGSLMQRARKSVCLSCPTFEISGEEMIPSYLMTKGEEESCIEHVPAFAAALNAPISARDAVAGMLWHEPEKDLTVLKSMLPLTTMVESLSEPLLVARSRAMQGAVGAFNGDLTELVKTGALSVTTPAQWSVSKLNEYGKCPFRYWAGQIIGAEPQEEPEAKLNPMVLGETYHKALELFYGTLLARKLTLTTAEPEELQRLFASAVNAALALLEQRQDVRHGEFWQYDRIEITFRLKRFFQKEIVRAQEDQEQFIPVMTEAGFGTHDGKFPAIKIRFKGRELIVRGKIDRVDVARQTLGSESSRIRVIDYKSGSTAISKEEAISGRNIQLPVYALAVERSIVPGSKVTSAAYLSVSSGEPSGKLSFEPSNKDGDSVNFVELAEQHIKNFVDGIESGDFTVRPTHRSVCSKCDHQSICRIKELPDVVNTNQSEMGLSR